MTCNRRLDGSYFQDCHARHSGWAGGIAIRYSTEDRDSINNNWHSLSNLILTSCSGGIGAKDGAGAGGVAISYSSAVKGRSMNYNSHSLSGLVLTSCSGEIDIGTGAGAGGVAISYNNNGKGMGMSHNSHNLSGLTLTSCSGGTGTKHGAGAGGVAISYYSYASNSNYNSHSLSGLILTSCSGGTSTQYGAGAGGVAIYYHSYNSMNYNSHNLIGLTLISCSGGTDTQYGAGAGGLAISYHSSNSGSIGHNSHNLSSLELISCSGGTGTLFGAGAGGVAISYYTETTDGSVVNSYNLHTLSNLSVSQCRGGDVSQGAGALAVVVARGYAVGCSVVLSRSQFVANQGGVADGMSQGVGVAGAVRLDIQAQYKNNNNNNSFRIWDTQFVNNSLSGECISVLCLAGTVALSGAAATIGASSFDSNSSPTQSGALFAQRGHLALESSVFSGNKAGATYSVASVESLTVHSTEMYFGQTAVSGLYLTNQPVFNSTKSGNAVFTNFSGRDVLPFGLQLGCPVGAQLHTPVANQFKCQTCASGQYSLAAGEWVDNMVQTNCSSCPDGDPSKVICSSNQVTAQPGQFVYYISNKTVDVFACINRFGCNRLDTINSACDTDLATCNGKSSKCTQGYTGMLCASCDSGWYAPKLDALTCKTCPNRAASMIVDPLLSVVLYIFAVVTSMRRSVNYGDCAEPEKSLVSGSFKMLIAHATILSSVSQVNWSWEDSVQGALNIPTAPSGSITELDVNCAFGWDFPGRVHFSIFYPLTKAVLALIAFGFSKVFVEETHSFWMFTTTGLYLFVGEAVATLFVIFPCYQAEEGIERMAYDPQSICGSHRGLVALSLIAMLVFVAPATYVLGYSFWKHQSIIKNPGTFDATKVQEVHAAFGFLFAEYKPEFFFWEWIVLIRKFLVILIAIWFPPATSMATRTFNLALLTLATFGLSCWYRPYALRTLNVLEIATQCTSLVSVFIASYVGSLGAAPNTSEINGKQVATVLFLLINFTIVLVHLGSSSKPAWAVGHRMLAKVINRFHDEVSHTRHSTTTT